MKKVLLLALFLLCVWKCYVAYTLRPVRLGEGPKAPKPPVQKNCPRATPSMNLKGFTLSPLAEYDITAKILSKKRYYRGDAAKLSPIDFALGWGLMSDEKHINRLKIKQNVRYYFWKTKDPRHLAPITISSNSANCHLIPATSEIRRQLLKVRIGSVVHLTGKLVQVNKANWIWKSSTSRDDTGNGACEIILVEEIRTILPKDP